MVSKWSGICSLVSDSLRPHGLHSQWTSVGQNTRVGIFPTQGSNPDLLHCRQILYPVNHKGSPSNRYDWNWDSEFWFQILCHSRQKMYQKCHFLYLPHSRSPRKRTPWGDCYISGHSLLTLLSLFPIPAAPHSTVDKRWGTDPEGNPTTGLLGLDCDPQTYICIKTTQRLLQEMAGPHARAPDSARLK